MQDFYVRLNEYNGEHGAGNGKGKGAKVRAKRAIGGSRVFIELSKGRQ